MNILFSITNLDDGGAQTFVVRLANYLSHSHRVFLFCLHGNPQSRIKSLLNPSVTLIFPYTQKSRIMLILRPFRRIRQILNIPIDVNKITLCAQLLFLCYHKRIDVISSHLYHSDQLLSCFPSWLRPPLCVTDHGDYLYLLDDKIASESEIRSILRRSSYFVTICQRNQNNIYSLSHRLSVEIKTANIYNGFKLSSHSPCDDEALSFAGRLRSASSFIFGMVARGIEDKGWLEALEAFEQIRRQGYYNCHLILVGDGPFLDLLKDSRIASSLMPYVHFVGFSFNPIQWIRFFDVALLPTYFKGESLPCSIIEYLSQSKPVIATDIGGIREMCSVGDSLPGFLIPLLPSGRPCITSLAEAMIAYLKDPSLLATHACRSSEAFKKFGIDVCASQYLRVFASA